MLVSVPEPSLTLYSIYGEYRAIEKPQILQAAKTPVLQQHADSDIDDMLEELTLMLQENPENECSCYILGRDQMTRQKYEVDITPELKNGPHAYTEAVSRWHNAGTSLTTSKRSMAPCRRTDQPSK